MKRFNLVAIVTFYLYCMQAFNAFADTTVQFNTDTGLFVIKHHTMTKPIVESRSILISMAAQTVPAGGNQTAFRSEPVVGQVTLKAPPGLSAYASLGDGRSEPIPARYEDGSYIFNLDSNLGTYLIVLRE